MTVSLHKISSADGYRYFLKSIAAGDGDRGMSTPLTRYYAETGTPPGRWFGSAVKDLGSGAAGRVREGEVVREEQLERLIGGGLDPVTGEPLGRRQQNGGGAVRGFDLSFSLPKSASILWGVADADLQATIARVHHEAIAVVLKVIEDQVAFTRVGAGGVSYQPVTGVAAIGFDHFDSRLHDPQLHTHVVIANRVRSATDGRWRTLDSQSLYNAVVAMSELHEGVVVDALTRSLGVGWEQRARGKNRHAAWEITGVPDDVVRRFSKRSAEIDALTDTLVQEYRAKRGRRPSAKAITQLRQRATLSTREDKEVLSLAELSARWRAEATAARGEDAATWARNVTRSPAGSMFRATDIPSDVVAQVAADVREAVGSKRSTWKTWHLYAEACRQTMWWRFTTEADRRAVVDAVVATARGESVRLTPPELATTPPELMRADGSSLRPRHQEVFTSQAILDAEARLLLRARTLTGPAVGVERLSERAEGGRSLTDEQRQVVEQIAASGRAIDVLVGAAGTGKTTTLRAIRQVWEVQHGRGSVIGLAPSATAAAVLGEEVGIEAENTAKWLHELDRGRVALHRGQLVLLDEAGMASTKTLDAITEVAELAGAKVVLVGDYAQLQSVEAGGAFYLLANDRDDVPELVDVHRFTAPWEKGASLLLRAGNEDAIDAYLDHSRVVEGPAVDMTSAAYAAWCHDADEGRTSVLVADSAEVVRDLNIRAQTERRVADPRGASSRTVALADETRAAAGDWITTRQNDRALRTRRGWVRNGDRWIVRRVEGDGSLVVHPLGRTHGANVTLPADYVAQHVELGYAVTAYRAQGVTVDASHVVATRSTTRENFYVAMTRGRDTNIAYVVTDDPDERAQVGREPTARTVLTGVLNHSGIEPSAHRARVTEHERWSSIAQLAAEYDHIATIAQRDGWAALVRASSLGPVQAERVIGSPAFDPLCASLRRAEAAGADPQDALAHAIARFHLLDADDIAAVLQFRNETRRRAIHAGQGRPGSRAGERAATHYVNGLVPEAIGPMSAPSRRALDERAALMRERGRELALRAMKEGPAWMRALPTPPTNPTARQRWFGALVTVVSYRDRHTITSDDPLGREPHESARADDRERAAKALARMVQPLAKVSARRMARSLDVDGEVIGHVGQERGL